MAFSWSDFVAIVIPLAISFLFMGLVAFYGMSSYKNSRKAPFTIPEYIQVYIWIGMYILLGFAGYLGYTSEPEPTSTSASNEKQTFLGVFYAQLLFAFGWCLTFFEYPRVGLIFLMAMLGTVIYLIYESWWVNKVASSLFIVYFAWLFYLAFLNVGYISVNEI